MTRYLEKWCINHALKKPADEWISSNDKNIDVKAVFLNFSGTARSEFRITSTSESFYSALRIYGDGHRYECSIPFGLISGSKLIIRHWYKGIDIRYDSTLDYLWGTISFFHLRHYLTSKRRQNRFNNSLRLREDKYDILQVIVNEHIRVRSLEGVPAIGTVKIDQFDLIGLVYGDEVWGHPNHPEISAKLDLITQSLADSKDIELNNFKISVKGKAVASIAKWSEDNRRHRDQKAYNSAIKWFTFAIAIATIFQAIFPWYSSLWKGD